MFDIIKNLIDSTIAPVQNNKITIEIPRDHPKLPNLLKLANALANIQHLSSGIVINRAEKIGAAEQMLDALKELGVDVDLIKQELKLNTQIDFDKMYKNINDKIKTGNILGL